MNRLQYEKSPYLLQHASNPVDWRPWGEEAFAAAREADKPVFLSIGYSTCHWCHVMARESFEDETTAAVINRDFIPVKVDREERPDVDGVYMDACVAMNGSGGWPLTVLLTPEQKPFWSGTYVPRDQLVGLLSQIAALWRTDRQRVETAGEEITAYLRREDAAAPGAPDRGLIHAGAAGLFRALDPRWGGFGPAPKFPMPQNLLFLLRYGLLTGAERAGRSVDLTLEHMARGGIFDHVGGGFSRYSTDERWLAPHFEKMLYDNALLAMTYAEAYQADRREVWKRTACRTLDYCLAELRVPGGGFCCGQDADSQGEEGRYYTFTYPELLDRLGEGAEAFCRHYGAQPSGNFHGKNILNLIDCDRWEMDPGLFSRQLDTLYAYRKERSALHRDDKVLTAWNGLMIAALARAGVILGRPSYRAAAEEAAAFIHEHMRDGGGRLLARWREGESAHPGTLDDYAFYAWGLLELYAATWRTEYLERAAAAARELTERFFDGENGGFYPYAADAPQLITRKKEHQDGAMPSGNAAAALVLSRLGRLTGEEEWRAPAQKQLRWLAGAAADYPQGHTFALLAMSEELWSAGELIVTGRTIPEGLQELLNEKPRPGLTVMVKTPENAGALERLSPFTAAYPIPDAGAMYYLCRNGACRQPVGSLDELKRLLEG